jgi:hypothetical protein
VGHRFPSYPFRQEKGLVPALALKKGKNAPVLVSQADLQVEDPLPQDVEAEVPGLNDPRVHRTHGHLVKPLHLVKGVRAAVIP